MKLSAFLSLSVLSLFCASHARAAAPSAPDFVNVAWVKYSDEFLVRWHPVPNATGYNVYRYDANSAAWVQVITNYITPPWNVLSFREPSGTEPGPATYAVSALNADGEGPIISASVVPGPGLEGTFWVGWDWWAKGYTFINPSFTYDRIDEGIDGMVELGVDGTNFTHAAWNTNFSWGQHLHITNLPPGTAWVTRMTMVNSNGIGISTLYPPWGVYTLPLMPIDVWEDTENPIMVGDYTWQAPAQVFTPAQHGTVAPGSYWWDWKYIPETNFAGIDTFQILDNPDGPPVTLTLNVQNVNDAPVPESFTIYVAEDTPTVITPPVYDIENDPYMVWIWDYPQHGVVYQQGTNFAYYPDPDFVGTDEFTYFAMDSQWIGTARATIVVTNVNDAPQAAPYASFNVHSGATFSGYLTGYDIDGDALSGEVVTPPTGGTVTISGTNFYYTPGPGEYFSDSFTFRLTDGQEWSGEGTIALSVQGPNTLPVAHDQSITVMEKVGETNFVLNVSDPDGDPIEIIFETTAAHGTLLLNGLNVYYRPDSNYFGADSFSYQAWDHYGTGNVATVSINVRANIRPVALPQNLQLAEDTSLAFTLAGLDQDGDPLTFQIVTQPSVGTLTGTAPNLVYRPATNYNGPDSFTFRVNDGRTNSNPATISFNVTPVNDAPVRLTPDQTFTFAEDTTRTFTVLASDVDGQTLTYFIVSGPTNGTITMLSATSWRYTPNTNWYGADVLRWAATDGQLQTSVGTLTFNVTAVNDVPVASAQSVSTLEDMAINIALTGSDPDGPSMDFQVTTIPNGGSLSGSGANRTYRPYTNWSGSDSLTFRIYDGITYSALATVSITVTPVNDLPVPANQALSVPEDQALNITLSAADVDDTQLSYAIAAGPSHGTLSGTPPNVVYTSHSNYNGPDSFTFTVTDNHSAAQTGTVSITVTAVNDAPVADSKSVTTAEDQSVAITLTGSDVEGSALTFSVVMPPAHGTFANGVYTPAANYNGSDSFTYKANDGQFDSAPVTVSITITPVNDAPIADSKSVSTAEDQSVAISLTGSDVDGDTLAFSVVTAPAHGAFVNGVYTPAANYNGSDSFSYKASDGQLDSTPATVSITVTAVNDAPAADSKSVTTAEDQSVAIALTGSDVDGDGLTFSVVNPPAHGTFANGVYTPAANYYGSDSFTYKANDGQLDSAVATVSITITGVNDAPVANAQSVSTAYNTAVNITLTGSDVEGSALTFVVVTTPANGTLTGTGASRTFTPNIGWSGTTSFTFKVNDGALDSATATVTITVAAPTSIPTTPTALTATVISQTQINLVWTDNSNNEDGFKIERSPNGSSSWVQIATVGPNATTYSNTGLTRNTRYYYRVRAYNSLGNSAYSNTVNAKTLN